jgi:hypothetical protein
MALSAGTPSFPSAWAVQKVGQIRMTLLTTPAVAAALGPRPTLDAIAHEPFIVPVYNVDGKFVPVVDDGFPLPFERRKRSHEVQTIALALELSARTGHLVYGPSIAAKAFLERARLVEVRRPEWDLLDPVFLASHIDRVAAKTQTTVTQTVRTELSRAERE